MRNTLNFVLISLSLAAFGCGSSTPTTTTDVPATTDTPAGTDTPTTPARVETIPCSGTPAAMVTAPGFAFTPMTTTIMAGQVVMFDMPATHNAASNDMLWNANFNTRTCVRFNTAGTYNFICTPHRFPGSIVVN